MNKFLFSQAMITRNRPPDARQKVDPGVTWTASHTYDFDTGSTDSGKPPSWTGKPTRPTSYSSVSSASSRGSYLSDSLRLGALIEEEHRPLPVAVEQVINELIETEFAYLNSLQEVITGYLTPLRLEVTKNALPLTMAEIDVIFLNLEEIAAFHLKIYEKLFRSHENLASIANVFIQNSEEFKIYTYYCTNLPHSNGMLVDILERERVRSALAELQKKLGHPLPLSTYLLKPFQRVCKYPDILQKLCKKMSPNEPLVEQALASMSTVASHINEVKRQHEDQLKLQELQSQLLNYSGPDLSCLGELVIDAPVYQGRQQRHVLLFHKLFILLKKHHDRFEVKVQIPTQNLVVQDRKDEECTFSVMPFDDIKSKIILTAITLEDKSFFCHHLKRLMMENHPAPVPNDAKDKILNCDAMRNSRNNRLTRMSSLPILDRERKRKSKKDRSRVAQSPARQVNSLPRPSHNLTNMKTIPCESPRVPIFGLPKRSSSFHIKSASISCDSRQLATPEKQNDKINDRIKDRKDKSLDDLSRARTPIAPRRFSSQIIRSTSGSSVDCSPLNSKPPTIPTIPTPVISPFSPPPPPTPILSPSIPICSPISSLSRLSSGSTSSLEEVIEEEDLRILSDDDSAPLTARRTSEKTENGKKIKESESARSSTQSAPGNILSASVPTTPKQVHSTTKTDFVTVSVPATPRLSFDSSNRRPSRQGRPAAETDGIIKTGKVAALLHRFSSTNRGKINSVYYDSNSEDEDQSASFTLARKNRRAVKRQEEENQDEDHLSTLFDATLEILSHIENDDDFSEIDEKL
ncbi:Oidioi.mRNA.OKI2018_I69.chr1.g142.t1.cds [Oikopleura dioica]|uniref:Oidioi.mRNA.OKI2018_I69.chr1.g142.t1.cds n=1 Tax=Oikopleura dioica TaxID=34765 RepID=A0ABN7SR57_OIKDI|nr:Oidioi.mRNA.OKI2018_I69.chr1.g142.t1.cds [Oikopleura dioica]